MKLSSWTIAFLFLLIFANDAISQEFYILQNGQLTVTRNGDPTSMKPEEWQIRLFPAGMPTNTQLWWGLITGATYESVQRQLQASQQFELSYNRFFGTTERNFTNFNTLGPIAKMPDPRNRRDADTAGRIFTVASRMLKLMDAAKTMVDVARNAPTVPRKNFGAVATEYFQNLRDAQNRLRDLQTRLDKGILADGLDQIMASITRAERAAESLSGAKTPAANSTLSGSVAYQKFKNRYGNLYEHKLVLNGSKLIITIHPDLNDPISRNIEEEEFDPLGVGKGPPPGVPPHAS